MGVFEKIKTGLEEAVAYERGTLEAVEKKYRIDMERNLRALRCSLAGMEHPWSPCAEKSEQADR